MFYFPCAVLSLVLVSNFVAKNRGMQKPLPQLPGGGAGRGGGLRILLLVPFLFFVPH